MAHTKITEHSHTNPEHNGPEAVRAHYPWFMQNGNNWSKNIKNITRRAILYVCFSRMLINLVQTLNEMKSISHTLSLTVTVSFSFFCMLGFLVCICQYHKQLTGPVFASHELWYPSAVHQSIRQQLIWPPGFAADIEVVINSQLFHIMFSSQADTLCLIVPAVWVEELERAWKMQETPRI